MDGLKDSWTDRLRSDVAFNYKKGQFTDDTGQALVLLDSIESTDYEPDTRDIALRMLAWAEKENAFENNILGPTSKVAWQISGITSRIPGLRIRRCPTEAL